MSQSFGEGGVAIDNDTVCEFTIRDLARVIMMVRSFVDTHLPA